MHQVVKSVSVSSALYFSCNDVERVKCAAPARSRRGRTYDIKETIKETIKKDHYKKD